MDNSKKNKILAMVSLVFVFTSIIFCAYRFLVLKDYVIFNSEEEISSGPDFLKQFLTSIKNGKPNL